MGLCPGLPVPNWVTWANHFLSSRLLSYQGGGGGGGAGNKSFIHLQLPKKTLPHLLEHWKHYS